MQLPRRGIRPLRQPPINNCLAKSIAKMKVRDSFHFVFPDDNCDVCKNFFAKGYSTFYNTLSVVKTLIFFFIWLLESWLFLSFYLQLHGSNLKQSIFVFEWGGSLGLGH